MQNINKNDTATIKSVVEENINRMEKIQISDVIEIIRPLYTFTPAELIERELKSKARYILKSFKDNDGVRIFFADSEGTYINVEKSEDVEDLNKVKRQLSIKHSGINFAMKKVKTRLKELMPKFKVK